MILAFMAALVGSLHCAGMCGGLVAAVAATRSRFWIYQVGRLTGYQILGLGAGLLGAKLVGFGELAAWLGALLILLALFSGALTRVLPAFKVPASYVRLYTRIGRSLNSSFGIGFWSAFLPCGWLYSFVVMAVATKSVLGGSGIMAALWLGSLPALYLGRTLLSALGWIRYPRTVALLMMALGLISLGLHMSQLKKTSTESPLCHVASSELSAPP